MTKIILILAITTILVAGIFLSNEVIAAPSAKHVDILDAITNAVTTITGAITSAQMAIVGEIDANEVKIDAIQSDVGMVKTTVGGIDTEVTNIEAKLDDGTTGLGAIKGAIDTIDTEVGNIEAKLDSGTTGLGAIKGAIDTIDTEVGNIEAKLDNSDFGLDAIDNSQYVPFTEVVTGLPVTCDAAGGSADFDFLKITSAAGTGSFKVTGIKFNAVGIDEATDLIQATGWSADGVSFGGATIDLTKTATPAVLSFDLMSGVPQFLVGNFPLEITATSAGIGIFVTVSCNAGTGSDIEFTDIVVSGWKQADDTITVTYNE